MNGPIMDFNPFDIWSRKYRMCMNCEYESGCIIKLPSYTHSCDKHRYATFEGDEPACDKSEYASCKACQAEWGDSLPPCANHPYPWVGTDESGYHHISISCREDIDIIKYKIANKQLLWLSVILGPENSEYDIMAMPHEITYECEGGFNVNVTLIGGDNFTGELILSNEYWDAGIVLSNEY